MLNLLKRMGLNLKLERLQDLKVKLVLDFKTLVMMAVLKVVVIDYQILKININQSEY